MAYDFISNLQIDNSIWLTKVKQFTQVHSHWIQPGLPHLSISVEYFDNEHRSPVAVSHTQSCWPIFAEGTLTFWICGCEHSLLGLQVINTIYDMMR